jgi:hypothetical protein
MGKLVPLTVEGKEGRRSLEFEVRALFCGGYAGRDQAEVRKHVEELRRIGVPAPERTPVAYPVSTYLLTTDDEIEVQNEETSGEVEYVVLVGEDKLYVTVGSDHTDREMEKISVPKAKQMYPKVIPRVVWLYDEVQDHWDELVIRSYGVKDGERKLYQARPLEALIEVETLMNVVGECGPGWVLFSGTIPTVDGELVYADEFEMEMYDPVFDRNIGHRYGIHLLTALG